MDITKEAFLYPFQKATPRFINEAIDCVNDTVCYVESEIHECLLDERRCYSKARKMWKGATNAQIVYYVAVWKSSICNYYLYSDKGERK